MRNKDMDDEAVNKLVAQVHDRYAPRIVAFLKSVQAAARAQGYTFRQGPYEMTDDEYRWELVGRRPGGGGEEALVDFSFTIHEARQFDGEPADGVNFALDIVAWGGQILGSITPYNYTSQVWVHASDPEAVETRFALLETADLSGLAEIL